MKPKQITGTNFCFYYKTIFPSIFKSILDKIIKIP